SRSPPGSTTAPTFVVSSQISMQFCWNGVTETIAALSPAGMTYPFLLRKLLHNPCRCKALVVKPQEVVPGQSESADRCHFGEASMGPVPVVAMQPRGEGVAALI